MYQKIEWKPWGLYIVDAIVYGFIDDFARAMMYHDLVARYMREHPGEVKELMPNGRLDYYRALWRAETQSSQDQLSFGFFK